MRGRLPKQSSLRFVELGNRVADTFNKTVTNDTDNPVDPAERGIAHAGKSHP